MRGFLRDLGLEGEDRNTDGRKCHNSKEKEEDGLLGIRVRANSCRLEEAMLLLAYDRFTQKKMDRVTSLQNYKIRKSNEMMHY